MPGTKSISEVKDLYDLIELYANLDRNNDGLLGPGEVSAEEIKAGDKESPSAGVPDGFLQPWEVMEMRGPTVFNPVETIRMRSWNKEAAYKGFPDIPSLPRDVEIGGVTYKSGTPLPFHLCTHYSRVAGGVLARPTILPSIPQITFPADSVMSFSYDFHSSNIRTLSVVLGADATINGVFCKKDTRLFFSDGKLSMIQSEQGFLINNVRYILAYFKDGALDFGDLAETARLPVNQRTSYLFQGRVQFNRRGMVKSGNLAEDVPSPYGARYKHPAGAYISFFADGTPMEGTVECFKAHFPGIVLSGSVSEKDILLAMETFSQLSPQTLANIKGIRFQYEELPTTLGDKAGGYANPFNKTIYMRKGNADSPTVSSIAHEAAHIRHLTLQEETTKRIAAATRHLDPSNPNDMVEDAAITRQIFSRSFDAKWSRAARYDFSFSIADLISYQRSLKQYDEGHTRTKVSDTTDYPKEGFINDYGRVSIWEDIATHVQMTYENPERYAQLIDAYSSFYLEHPDQRPYAQVYRAKLELLREYGFITEAKYREIVPVHPDVVAFCGAVNCP
ncbi:MAG: hypothetical protein WC956_00100 [bacterium]